MRTKQRMYALAGVIALSLAILVVAQCTMLRRGGRLDPNGVPAAIASFGGVGAGESDFYRGGYLDPDGLNIGGSLDPNGLSIGGHLDPNGLSRGGSLDPDGLGRGGSIDPNGVATAAAAGALLLRGGSLDPNGLAKLPARV